MTKAIKLIFVAMICLLLLGCAKNNKNKTFLYLGGVEEDKEMKLEYKICNIDDNNIYLSFEVEKYSSSIKYIRTINVTDGGEIKEIYCNSKKMDLNNHIELIDSGTTKIDVYLTKESKGEFLDIYIYQHKMITLYVSEEAMPGYTPLEVVNYSRLNRLYY